MEKLIEENFTYTSELHQKGYYIIGEDRAYHLSNKDFEVVPNKGDKIKYLRTYSGDVRRIWVNGIEVKVVPEEEVDIEKIINEWRITQQSKQK